MADVVDAQHSRPADPSPLPPEWTADTAPRVAVKHLGGRAEKLMRPLRASALTVAVDPPDPGEFDVIMCDQPRYKLGYEVFAHPNTPVAYRVRGNIWKEMDIWRFGRAKKAVAERVVYPRLNGAVAVDERLARIFKRKTGVDPVGAAGLPKVPANWPSASHDRHEDLRLVTLTNLNYRQKIEPMKPYIAAVNRWLREHGGVWHICGEGMHADDFAAFCEQFSHVEFPGYVDPENYLPDADAMIHVSEFDAYPNAVLEGFASNLPVLTNDFAAFQRERAPNITHREPATLLETLDELRAPGQREALGTRGQEYLRTYHTPAYVGRQYTAFFATLATP